jgi:hypothetical protein
MSDKIITLNDHGKGHAERSRDQESTPINARLQWVADLVCAILDAENIKRSITSTQRLELISRLECRSLSSQ